MKVALTELIPGSAQIEISDIGYLFYHYILQNPMPDPQGAAEQWFERMNDVVLEEWGVGIDFRTWLQ